MAKIKCSFSQCDITPRPNETMQDGYGSRLEPGKEARTKIFVKICSMCTSDSDRFLILSADVCGFDHRLSEIIKDTVRYMTGVPQERIALCATHTHTGPACGVLESCGKNLIYWYRAAEIIARAAAGAVGKEEEGTFEFRISSLPLKTIYNRCGRDYLDRRVKVGVFKNGEGAIKGLLVSASSHPTVLGDYLYSGDYPGVMTVNMSVDYPGVPVVFLQGRGADTNPYLREKLPADYLVNKLGTELSDSIKAGINELEGKPVENYGIKSSYEMKEIPRKGFFTEEEYEQKIAAEYDKLFKTEAPVSKRCVFPEIEWLKMCRDMQRDGKAAAIKAPLQVLKIADGVIFTFIPFELLCITGNTIEDKLVEMGYKRESIFVVGYANEVLSYLAPAKDEIFDKGGYDIGGAFGAASHWYNVPDCSKATEPAVIDGIMKLVNDVK